MKSLEEVDVSYEQPTSTCTYYVHQNQEALYEPRGPTSKDSMVE